MKQLRTAVIGGAGYVGLEVCRQLVGQGHDVTAVASGNGEFLLSGLGVRVIAPLDLETARGFDPDVVINLAYPTKGSFIDYPRRNREILSMISTLADKRAHVVHVSTQAVFGYGFEHPVRPEPVAMRRDHAYIEAKIELEWLLLRSGLATRLDIVRLGNVWGPASPTWTAAIAEKLTFLDPVGITGSDGYSNVTDVANVASYLLFLIENRPDDREAAFHHLAELGNHRWSEYVELLANALRVQPRLCVSARADRQSFWHDMRSAVQSLGLTAAVRGAYRAPVSGSVARSVLRALPTRAINLLKARHSRGGGGSGPTTGDATFLQIMSGQTHFEPAVRAEWIPPVTFQESLGRVVAWMERAGYVPPTAGSA